MSVYQMQKTIDIYINGGNIDAKKISPLATKELLLIYKELTCLLFKKEGGTFYKIAEELFNTKDCADKSDTYNGILNVIYMFTHEERCILINYLYQQTVKKLTDIKYSRKVTS